MRKERITVDFLFMHHSNSVPKLHLLPKTISNVVSLCTEKQVKLFLCCVANWLCQALLTRESYLFSSTVCDVNMCSVIIIILYGEL